MLSPLMWIIVILASAIIALFMRLEWVRSNQKELAKSVMYLAMLVKDEPDDD